MFRCIFNKVFPHSDATIRVMARLERVQEEWLFTVYQQHPSWNAYVPALMLDATVVDRIFDYMSNRTGSDWAKLAVDISRNAVGELNCTITEQS